MIGLSLSHIRLRSPPNRSSLWRHPDFQQYNPRPNYDDAGLYCGRVLQKENDTRCGICGDPITDKVPRPNENGGIYGKGIIAGRYTAGDAILLSVEFAATHFGYFEVHLCDQFPETDSCFRKLKFEDGSEKYRLAPPKRPLAGDSWGYCGNGREDMGCGLQETFRSCADISIQ
ncbi:unnamed protein product [Allacma fusca]|uniref:Chitin-binding type-4 domain-containing protein n=1 Tax=Allacma fusca TaxID=39272 RepID=A0A8J2J1N8_9HEXA|nr:unnamed protein product [Allacma fusca]